MSGDEKGHFTASDGQTIAWVRRGPADASPIVLAHPIGLAADVWKPVAERLAGRFCIIAYDGRGHGDSSVPAGDYTIKRLAADAVELLDSHKLARVHFCGLSLGGMVGQALALDHPQRLLSVALCNTAAYMGPPQSWIDRAALVLDGGMDALLDTAIGRWLSASFRDEHPEIVLATRSRLAACAVAGYVGNCAAIRDLDFRDRVQDISTPTLVVTGRHDPATPPPAAREMAAAITGSILLEMETSHLSCVEMPDILASHLAAFFTACKRQ
jgi:3-oxoadipate enol-lactonase